MFTQRARAEKQRYDYQKSGFFVDEETGVSKNDSLNHSEACQTRGKQLTGNHYLCPGVPDYLPSVTSILSATQSAKTQQKLITEHHESGAADEAAERGSFIHNSVENHLRGLQSFLPKNMSLFGEEFQSA